ncbi:hypothetical protein NUU61_007823 [Penicillium alfredii]|uniref:Uncharacterized protein n=1 Tax=Penicillium alfredii TaxID=1506179 RepID=A0A9W9ERH1_9EURO|nr:uncharacterized protein NUU61_007823 [Penicillium alfredii]KAJ5086516.1 hypothetical protein NUU61_007823 [Penicillium alfredii]
MNLDNPGNQPQRARPTRLSSTIIKFLWAGLVLLLALLISFIYSSRQSPLSPDTDSSSGSDSTASPTHNCLLPITRYDIYTGQVACYPSSGGIWMAELGPLELQHLNINRFESTERSWNQADEDKFCDQLRPFGGSWYTQSADDLWVGGECHELHEFEPALSIHRQIAFPENGGVWVLAIEGDALFPPGMATVRNALTMEERCKALEKLGAVFCADLTKCSALQDLSQQPSQLVRKKKLDDAPTCGGAL